MLKKLTLSFLFILFMSNVHAEGFPDEDSRSGIFLKMVNGNNESLFDAETIGLLIKIPADQTNVTIEIFGTYILD